MDREEIVAKVIENTGINIDEATTMCHNWIDYVQDDIVSRHNWSFLKKYGKISTIESYSSGTIAVNQDSTTVTGTGTVWTSSMVGRYIYLPDENYYKITGFVSPTEITIETAYIGEATTGKTYVIIAINYSLPSNFGTMKFMRRIVPSALIIPNIPEIVFTDYIANPYSETGEINAYMYSGFDSNGYQMIRFRPIQQDRKLVEICYIAKLSSINTEGAESEIPTRMHQLFIFKLSELVFDMVDLDAKAEKYKIYYEEAIAKFISGDMSKSLDRIERYPDERIFKSEKVPTVGLSRDHFERI